MPKDDDRDFDRPDDDREDRPRRRRRQEDDDYDDRPRRRKKAPEIEATDFLIPTNVSAASMAACYFGIFSCFLPFLGFLMALIALPCGIVALRRRTKANTYGAVTGDIRAIVGVISSTLTILGHLVVLVFYILIETGSIK
jgi:uncharacterized BrkB/YihY/UPF0761 family membrane protein